MSMRVWKRAAAALSMAAGVVLLPAAPAGAAHARAPRARPVVVELFTAQGCTACPQANALLQELAGKPGVVALTFPVDVWDYLGWADTLARPEFTARQKLYAQRFRLREIYTPEMVVDGRRETLGFDRGKVQGLIASAPRLRASGPAVVLAEDGARVRVGAGAAPGEGAHVWLVRFDPKERTVKVQAGDNKGKTVVQQNVVRELRRLGAWSGRARSYRLPAPAASGLSSAVLVQADRGGPILAVAVAP
jgi:hypothetical protein